MIITHDQVPLNEMAPAQDGYDAAYKGGLGTYAIKIYRRAARLGVMLYAVLIVWYFLLALTAVGAISADWLSPIGGGNDLGPSPSSW